MQFEIFNPFLIDCLHLEKLNEQTSGRRQVWRSWEWKHINSFKRCRVRVKTHTHKHWRKCFVLYLTFTCSSNFCFGCGFCKTFVFKNFLVNSIGILNIQFIFSSYLKQFLNCLVWLSSNLFFTFSSSPFSLQNILLVFLFTIDMLTVF